MPHTSSAKKRLRQMHKRRARNRATKKAIKIEIKEYVAVVENKDSTPEQIQTELSKAVKKLDKAAAKRVIHPNTAARRKSQLARMFNVRKAAGSGAK